MHELPDASPLDPASYSRPDVAIVTNLMLSLTVSFEKKIFYGSAHLVVKKLGPHAREVLLDTRDLKIIEIYEVDLNKFMRFYVGKPHGQYGSKLWIALPPKKGNTYSISIHYETSPNASGLQWLEPEQTAGNKYPYVYSQFLTAHARSVIPCQDTPYVKTPYKALITAPKHLTVVMSSPHRTKRTEMGKTMYCFIQNVPVSSYLIAIAIGDIECREIGPRSHVWAEKEVIDKAVYEFGETEEIMKIAESICGPYLWGIYDILVLPPSFPVGGMENPCLTFVTPILLAGDRSMVNIIIHELLHSWTGNLVTHRNFEHFWLNEGLTVFLERKIIGHLISQQEQDFQAYQGTTDLKFTIDQLGHDSPISCLQIKLTMHPDDSLSMVPYEKGCVFLRYLEIMVGGPEKFEPFIRSYIDTFMYKTVDTDIFVTFFKNYFEDNPCIEKIDWNTWLHCPGMPPILPKYDDTLMEQCMTYKNRWLEWDEVEEEPPFEKNDLKKLSTRQVMQLLQEIYDQKPQPVLKLQRIQKLFNIDAIQNAEIKFQWLRIGLKARWKKKIDSTIAFINTMSRVKFVKPLYGLLYEWKEARQKAIDNFIKHQPNLMHVVVYTISKELHLKL